MVNSNTFFVHWPKLPVIFLAVLFITLFAPLITSQATAPESQLSIISFLASPQSLGRGGYVDFTVSISNTAQTLQVVSPKIVVLDSLGAPMYSLELETFEASAGASSIFSVSVPLELPSGNYKAHAEINFTSAIGELKTASSTEAPLSIIASTPSLQRIHKQITQTVKFAEKPLLFEVYPEMHDIFLVVVQNAGNAETRVALNISGAAADWLSLQQDSFVLQSGEKREVAVAITVPQDATAGEYLAEFKFFDTNTGGYSGSEYTLFKVTDQYRLPFVTRSITLDAVNGEAKFKTTVKNVGAEKFGSIKIIDLLPVEIARDPSSLEFQELSGSVKKHGGDKLLVSLEFTSLAASQIASATYIVKSTASTPIEAYGQVIQTRQYNMRETTLQDLFQVLDTYLGVSPTGSKKLFVNVSYIGAEPISAKIGLVSDYFYNTDPLYLYVDFSSGEAKEFVFEAVQAEGSLDNQSMSIVIETSTGIADFPLFVAAPQQEPSSIGFAFLDLGQNLEANFAYLPALLILITVLIIIARRRNKRRKMQQDRQQIITELSARRN